ncbi:MAG: hypothetical protein IPG86_07550 [Chitinophagaceae bacterium]|nr:hypothetical protein [Chitinophagaceae bacterium]
MTKLNQTYIIGHWGLTLLIAPFISEAIESVFGKNPHQIAGLLEFYPITLVFSIIFSLPTLMVYLASFYFLSKKGIKISISKLILIAITVSGIFITQTFISGSMSKEIVIAYSLAGILTGTILRLKLLGTNNKEDLSK